MKELYKYYGRLNKYNPAPDHSFVTLKDEKTGELYETNAVSEMLAEKGIAEDDTEFEVTVVENDSGKIEAILTKLEPKPVPPERVAEILKECEHLKDFCI